MAKFQIGDLVRLNKRVAVKHGEGEKETARVLHFYSDIPGGVRLASHIGGFVSWNVKDLVRVSRPRAVPLTLQVYSTHGR
jgi:hypothetical protein